MVDAVSIVDDAREQARALIEEASRSRAEIEERARVDGEAQGLQRYIRAIDELTARLDLYFAGAEPELVKLAVGIARKVLGEELRLNPDAVLAIARQSLAGARRSREITLRVNPSDAPGFEQAEAALRLPASVALEVRPDPAIESGGCVIETDLGVIDARLETQLRVIERALERGRG